MKRNLIYTLIAGFLVLGILSFTLIKEKPVKKTVEKVKVKKPICNAEVFLTAVNWTPTGITIQWSATNTSYDHFNYGGYGVVTPGTTYGNSMSYGFGGTTSRFAVVCACAGGGTSGAAHGAVFSSSGYSVF